MLKQHRDFEGIEVGKRGCLKGIKFRVKGVIDTWHQMGT